MAYRNKIIINSRTHQETRFLQTNKDTRGKLLEMEVTYGAHSPEPAAHYHPQQDEEFIVLSGELTVRIDEQLKILKPGDRLDIPKNKVHSMWNNSDSKTSVNWKVKPAMESEYFFETFAGLANDGKTNEKGLPSIPQLVITIYKYNHLIRIPKVPFIILQLLYIILIPIALLIGLRPTYKKYLD